MNEELERLLNSSSTPSAAFRAYLLHYSYFVLFSLISCIFSYAIQLMVWWMMFKLIFKYSYRYSTVFLSFLKCKWRNSSQSFNTFLSMHLTDELKNLKRQPKHILISLETSIDYRLLSNCITTAIFYLSHVKSLKELTFICSPHLSEESMNQLLRLIDEKDGPLLTIKLFHSNRGRDELMKLLMKEKEVSGGRRKNSSEEIMEKWKSQRLDINLMLLPRWSMQDSCALSFSPPHIHLCEFIHYHSIDELRYGERYMEFLHSFNNKSQRLGK
ncbi:hypothetical protein SNEBB_004039 [Seison nebaliae]|nr:hypothetical protein SNEBB_004039 [Seison nebaliae]